MPTGTLSGAAKSLWEKIFNASKAKGDSPEVAAKKAWAGVKSAGWSKNKDGEWVKGKADVFAEFSMAVAKVAFDKDTQERHITLVASDTDPDLADEKMSVHLFQDFVNRIENQQEVPEPFRSAICEENWCGGQPYLSISHYKSAGGKNVPGEIRVSYVDGNRFKSKAILHDTVLGKAVFKSLNDDLTGKGQFEDKVRVSIGFLDLAHKHGDFLFERKSLTDVCPKCAEGEGDKEYWEGVLVHEAFTRKPMNPRTDVEVEKMAITTKQEDAESIVGAEALAELDLEAKSQVAESDLIVIRSEEDELAELLDEHLDEKSALKSEGGCKHPASHYMVHEDAEKPTTWHLRFKGCDGKIDTRLLGAAKAALTVGYRGNKYEGPEKEAALRKLKGLYKSAGLEWKADLEEPMPDEIVEEVVVTEANHMMEDCPEGDEECKKKMADKKAAEAKKSAVEPAPVVAPVIVVETAVDKAVNVLKAKIAEAKAAGEVGDSALSKLQPAFNELGNAVKSEFTPKLDPVTANIAEIVRSAVAEQMALVVAPLEAKLAELSTKSSIATMQKRDEGIVARSLTLRPQLPEKQEAQKSLIERLAYQSTEPR